MSTKYDAGDRKLVEDDIALTDHAIMRYRQRTPHDCDLDPREAWRRGEFIEHPQVAQGPNEDEPPERVRLYTHGDEDGSQTWGVAFLVDEADQATIAGHCPYIVVTVVHIQGFDHGPSRSYLHSHGAHGGGSQ